MPRRTFDVFDVSRLDELTAAGRDVRVVHMVRHAQVRRRDASRRSSPRRRPALVHARPPPPPSHRPPSSSQGTHNVDASYRDPKNHDARLTPFGEQQCAALAASSARAVAGATLVVTSPMTRCVQTALLSFPCRVAAATPFVAHESLRETVNFACDARRNVSELRRDFPSVDFSLLAADADPIWARYEAALDRAPAGVVPGGAAAFDDHRESANLRRVADRGCAFFAWLETRPERDVAASSHSAFLRCVLSWGHPGGVRGAPEQRPELFEEPSDEDAKTRRGSDEGKAVVAYGGDDAFEARMREEWGNCEMRTFLVAY